MNSGDILAAIFLIVVCLLTVAWAVMAKNKNN